MTIEMETNPRILRPDGEKLPVIVPKTVVCAHAVRLCVGDYDRDLRAIVLTGSLARDEGTFLQREGAWNLFGDAEFLLVFRERSALPPALSLVLLEQSIHRVLMRHGIFCSVSLSAAHPEYLRKLTPHIFAYELRACGQVVWGDRQVLSLIPVFRREDIPVEDAWCLLANRIVEHLEVADGKNAQSAPLPMPTQYRTVKLCLDMTTSLLVFAGAYEPTYRRRQEALALLAERQEGRITWPFPPDRFQSLVKISTAWKLFPEEAEDKVGWEFWEDTISHAWTLWRWELSRLTGGSAEESEGALLQKWMHLQPPQRRLRGWLYVLRKLGWHRSWREWPRWVRFGWRASPRFWLYAAASQVFFRLPDLLKCKGQKSEPAQDWDGLRNQLPLPKRLGNGPRARGWRGLATDILWNYHEFLEETRS